MKLLFDIYSDNGSITYDSGSLPTMLPENLLDSVPTYWGSNLSPGPHKISSSITIGDGYPAPIDTFAINIGSARAGSIARLRLFDSLDTELVVEERTLSGLPGWLVIELAEVIVATKWELEFTNPSATNFQVVASRVLAGLSWIPNIGITVDLSVAKQPYSKPVRFRNGGVYVPPSYEFRSITLSYEELDKVSTFALQDALGNYGSGTSILAFGLVGTTALTFTSIYGRIREWGKPKLSISGNYSIGVTIEETT